jgi:hypothetical protein
MPQPKNRQPCALAELESEVEHADGMVRRGREDRST